MSAFYFDIVRFLFDFGPLCVFVSVVLPSVN